MTADDKLTRHHMVPRDRGGCNCPTNIVKLPWHDHRKWHERYGNMTPYEIIRYLEKKLAQRRR